VATRFYFTTAAATYTPTSVRGTWGSSTLAATQTFDLARAKAGTNTLTSQAETVATNNYKVLLHRHVSGPLAGGTLTGGAGTGYTHAEARQQTSGGGMTVCVHIWFTVGDTSVVRSTFANMFVGGTQFATTMTNFYYTTPDTATATFQAGDRMVIEMGYNAANTVTTSFTGSMRIGGTAADAGTTATTTGVTTNSPWIEFPAAADAALAAYTPPAATDNSLLLPVTYGRYRPLLVR
jgi:hypothetical protein